MDEQKPVRVCGEHQLPLVFDGPECPWCAFAREVAAGLESEYKRGFEDGARAALEDANEAKRSDVDEQQATVDRASAALFPVK